MRLARVLAGIVAAAMMPSLGNAQTGVGAPFGARDPAACPAVRQAGPPSPQQAALLIRCKREVVYSGELWLMENVTVEIGGPRPFADLYNVVAMPDADTKKPVYPVRGSWTWSVCREPRHVSQAGKDPSLNCRESDVPAAAGACWSTTGGAWNCAMTGSVQPTREPTRPPR
jgi:hypothetical protein